MNKQLRGQYELLLEKKAKAEKESSYFYEEYLLKFGDALLALFEDKLQCITLKKKITYCIKRENAGEPIYESQLNAYIDEEIADFEERLEHLTYDFHFAKSNEDAPLLQAGEELAIKKLYRMIAHLIHPDLHPEYQGNGKMEELWNKAVDAYKRNDYKALTQAYDQILLAVKKEEEVDILDVEEKIAQVERDIEEIESHPPYTYKFILESQEMIQEEHDRIQEERDTYSLYLQSLENTMRQFTVIHDIGA